MDIDNPYSAPTAVVVDPVSTSQGMEAIRREHIRHEVSLKSIGTLYGLGCLLMAIGSMGVLIPIMSGDIEVGQNPMLIIGMAAFYIVMCAILFAMAYGFRKLSSWVKIPGTLFATVGLLGFPIGTLINGYILYLIWCRQGRTILEPGYHEIIRATPHVEYKRTIGDKVAFGILIAFLVGIVVLFVISTNN